MFANFTDQWPTLPGRKGKNNGTAASVAGESVAASDLTDLNGSSIADGRSGGVSLGNLSLRDLPPIGTAPADRLRRYVEGGKENDTSFTGHTSASGYD
jgi:regulator of nonsense transcripts 1